MSLRSRLKKLGTAMPKCRPGIMRLAVAGQVPSEAERCPRCGGTHILYITEVIVKSRAEAKRYLAMNGEPT